MNLFLRHFGSRIRWTVSSPGTLLLYVLAGVVSLVLWPWVVSPTELGENGYDALILFMSVYLWPMFLLLLASGRTLAGSLLDGLSGVPLPALPLGPRSRALAESLAALAVVLAVRIPFGLLAPTTMREFLLLGYGGNGGDARLEFFRISVLGTLASLPVLLAWLAPTGSRVMFLVRPLVVATILVVVLSLGLAGRPVVLGLACVTLSALVLLLTGSRLEDGKPRSRADRRQARPAVYRRPYRPASAQLRRDALLGPFRGWWPALFAIVAADVVSILLARYDVISPVARYGFSSALMGSIWGAVVFRPLGLPLIGRTGRLVGGGERAGAFLAAWKVRPVRPESVLRAVYLHGILFAIAFTVVASTHMWMTTALGVGLDETFQRRFLMAMLAIGPCVSGFLVGTAVGNSFLGTLGFLSALAVLPTHILLMVSRTWRSLDVSDEVRAVIHVCALIILAAVGGGPALRYLRSGGKPRE